VPTKSWKFLRPGDVVDVVAPGFATKPEVLEEARQFLIRWDLIPRIPKGMISPHFLHSNDDAERFRFLKEALLSKDSAAVWCLRGGYGANRLIPMLAKVRAPKNPKLVVGISDVTSIHTFLLQEWGWSTLHGPLLDRLGAGKVPLRIESELRKMVFGQLPEITLKGLKPMNDSARKVRTLRASVTGGNLIVLQGSLGTPWQFDAKGKFLAIEDLGERGYRVDRVLEHFRQAGRYRGCKGLLVGDFLGGDEPDGRNLVGSVLKRWARDLDLPVFSGLPIGHGVIQRPLPFGPVATLQAGSSFELKISSGGRP
jgi:muramoyltetrapeptide carboxypeptidase